MQTEKDLQKFAAKILRTLGVRPALLDIILLPNVEMKRMKWRLMRKKTEPNVISFPEPAWFPHPEAKKRYLGEIYLNKDILKKSPERAAPLLVHGMLHLLGYDHMKKKEAASMEQLEKEVLEKLSKSHFDS
jgi:probable rRNA maturation factor